jgi:integrase
MIQLRNGSRISESINAFRKFINDGYKKKVIIKIAKSEGIKYVLNKYDKEKKRVKIITKPRYRKMMFPNSWIETDNLDELFVNLKKTHEKLIYNTSLRLNITNYMSYHFNCNTHSLRYAFINYMIYDQKRPLNDVAKFVGHANTNQLVTYTQQKNCEQIFDLDI